MWYESLYSQLRWQHHNELMKIVRPNAEDFRNLTVVRTNTKPKRKLAQSTNQPSSKGDEDE